MMDLQNVQHAILEKLADKKPDTAAMFLKNWKRYEASLQFLDKAGVLKKETRILDYGCGHPVVAAMLLKLGYNCVPYEPYAGQGELSSAELLGIRDSYKTTLGAAETFDVVLMIDVIEHLSIIKPVMQDVQAKVKPGGFLFISTPNVMRAEMWLAFVFRQTGHPQALNHYLESDDNYTHHQREFTMGELKRTVKHFGFSTVHEDCRDTRPGIKELNRLRAAKQQAQKSEKGKLSLKHFLHKLLIALFPGKMNNNLLLLAKKK
jgi:2-polyprenyl-3-methyl-5-hydroxy-6-metoxy-1,4-benzoquinol methylase